MNRALLLLLLLSVAHPAVAEEASEDPVARSWASLAARIENLREEGAAAEVRAIRQALAGGARELAARPDGERGTPEFLALLEQGRGLFRKLTERARELGVVPEEAEAESLFSRQEEDQLVVFERRVRELWNRITRLKIRELADQEGAILRVMGELETRFPELPEDHPSFEAVRENYSKLQKVLRGVAPKLREYRERQETSVPTPEAPAPASQESPPPGPVTSDPTPPTDPAPPVGEGAASAAEAQATSPAPTGGDGNSSDKPPPSPPPPPDPAVARARRQVERLRDACGPETFRPELDPPYTVPRLRDWVRDLGAYEEIGRRAGEVLAGLPEEDSSLWEELASWFRDGFSPRLEAARQEVLTDLELCLRSQAPEDSSTAPADLEELAARELDWQRCLALSAYQRERSGDEESDTREARRRSWQERVQALGGAEAAARAARLPEPASRNPELLTRLREVVAAARPGFPRGGELVLSGPLKQVARLRWSPEGLYMRQWQRVEVSFLEEFEGVPWLTHATLTRLLRGEPGEITERWTLDPRDLFRSEPAGVAAEPRESPEVAPEAVPEAAPEAAPEAVPEATPEAAPEAVPEATPEAAPEAPEVKPEAPAEP